MRARRWEGRSMGAAVDPQRRLHGVVKTFDYQHGVGVIVASDGSSIRVDASQIVSSGAPQTLAPGQRVTFVLHLTAQGDRRAGNVVPGGYSISVAV